MRISNSALCMLIRRNPTKPKNRSQYCHRLINPWHPSLVLISISTKVPRYSLHIAGFISTDGPGTKLSDLNPSLAAPNSSEEFTMHFVFSKPMDASTVTSPAYWSITRADGQNLGGAYNWGLPSPSTEVTISPTPVECYL